LSSARIEELRKKFDENPRRYFAPLANEYRKVGDFDQAIFICQEYLPQQPGHMSGHIVFGQALFEAKRLPEAKTVFETALSLDPENLIALRHLADISRDLGDVAAAKSWYERVLQADPRNDEVVAIVEKLSSATSQATAATAEIPEVPSPEKRTAHTLTEASAAPDSAAPTVVLSAAEVAAMLKARQGSRVPETVHKNERMNLDSAPTVEIRAGGVEESTMEGLEQTAQAAPLDMPSGQALGLETNAAPGLQADAADSAPTIDSLDTLSLDLPPTPPAFATPAESATPSDDGLLDLGSFSIGGGTAAAPASEPSPADTPIDGGHDLIDLDFGPPPQPVPAADPAPEVPTVIMDAVKSVVPAVQDAVESAAPALMNFVSAAVPSVVDAVRSTVEAVAETPTAIMQAIKQPTAAPSETEPRTSQSVPFVTETMAQLYLSQGHHAEAIEIYKKLIEARPNDAGLKARLASIEAGDSRTTPLEVSAPAEPARFAGSGPSIRTVLRELFGIDSAASFASAQPTGVASEVGSIDTLFNVDSPAALSPLAVAFDGGHVASHGTIDALFSGRGR
jgi:tetratricopeptide (TPR) repeat protein